MGGYRFFVLTKTIALFCMVRGEQGNVKILPVLHERGLQANSRDSIGMISLHAGCKCGKFEADRYLIAIRADPSIKGTYRRTPSIAAFQHGQSELMILCRNEDTNKAGDYPPK
jgi:ankyrin repeat protein